MLFWIFYFLFKFATRNSQKKNERNPKILTRMDCPSPDFCLQRIHNCDKDVLKLKREVVRERKREGEVMSQTNKQLVEIEGESNATSLLLSL